jgi:hypothetical protein
MTLKHGEHDRTSNSQTRGYSRSCPEGYIKPMRPLMNDDNYGLTYCPYCAGHAVSSTYSKVVWDDEAKRFHVQLLQGCRECGHEWGEGGVSLPVLIATASRCSCGAGLRISEHSFTKIGDTIEFKGTFVCDSCNRPARKTVVELLISAIASLWKQTKSIKIGPDGVEYSKTANGE